MATTSELETIIAFVVTTLAAVSGLAHVYDYELLMKQGEDITSFLKDAGWINYAFVECVSTQEAWQTNEEIVLTHDLVIKSYGEVQDEATSAPAFRQLTSRIADTFRSQYRVPDSETALILGPAQTPVRGILLSLQETFIVHHSEQHLSATERVTL